VGSGLYFQSFGFFFFGEFFRCFDLFLRVEGLTLGAACGARSWHAWCALVV
jgi:hypothetical protein